MLIKVIRRTDYRYLSLFYSVFFLPLATLILTFASMTLTLTQSGVRFEIVSISWCAGQSFTSNRNHLSGLFLFAKSYITRIRCVKEEYHQNLIFKLLKLEYQICNWSWLEHLELIGVGIRNMPHRISR